MQRIMYKGSVAHSSTAPIINGLYEEINPGGPAMIVLHGFTMRKEDLLEESTMLNEMGISTLNIDLPYHGERKSKCLKELSVKEINVGLEQALDEIYLSAQTLVERGHTKVSILGYSLGGVLVLTALGKWPQLFERSITIAAGGDIAELIMNSPLTEEISKRLKREVTEQELRSILEKVDPCSYAETVDPEKLLMINAKKDTIVPQQNVNRFVSRLRGHPFMQWGDGEHSDYDLNTTSVYSFLYSLCGEK